MKYFFIILIFICDLQASTISYDIAEPIYIGNPHTGSLDENLYQTSGSLDILQVLEETSSLYKVQNGGPGQPSSLYLRGSSSSEYKVFLDDVDLSDSSSIGNTAFLEHLSSHLVSEVSISKRATLSDSLNTSAGQIKLKTIGNQQKPFTSFNAEYGSFDSLSLGGSSLIKIKKSQTLLGVDYFQSEGISAVKGGRESDSYQRYNILFSHGYKLNSTEIKALYFQSKGETEIDGFGDDLVKDDLSTFNQELFSLAYKDNFLQHNIKTENSLSRQETSRDYPFGEFQSKKYNLKSKNSFLIDKKTLFTGRIQVVQNKSDQYSPSNSIEVFANADRNIGDNNLSIGYGVWRNNNYGDHDSYEAVFSRSFQFLDSEMEASFVKSLKEPSLFQIYDPYYGNEAVKPAEIYSYNLTFSAFTKQSIFSFYRKEVKNDIVFVANKYDNLGNVRYQGFEFDQKITLTPAWSFKLSYSFVNMENLSSQDFLLERPKHRLNLKMMNKLSDKIYLSSTYSYTGSSYNNGELPAYALVDMGIDYFIQKNMKTYLKINNLLDKDYEQIKGYSTMPRTLKLGIVKNL